jgi:hypothetical protein
LEEKNAFNISKKTSYSIAKTLASPPLFMLYLISLEIRFPAGFFPLFHSLKKELYLGRFVLPERSNLGKSPSPHYSKV